MFANPLPDLILGDPFVLRHGGRFYLYGTNDGPPLADGRAIPVYRSDDLLNWEPLGGALEPLEPGADHWAPEVLAWNGRFYMVVSFGDVEQRGHALWIAVAERPEGPFAFRQRVSDPSEAFAIDGSWLLDDDGRLYLFHCLDYIAEDDPPHGTGIVVRPMRDPLTPAGLPKPVLRAHAPWHLFEAERVMPLYGGRTFSEWTTIEGPAPVKRRGRYFCGYSGGNYGRAYGTGEAVADGPLGPYTDLRGREGPLFGTTAGLVEGPGHFSVVRPDLVHDWIVLHGRRPGRPGRSVWLCPASWEDDGVRIGPLTDRPQPAPPLPLLVVRGAGFD
ncbi:MAG TPA: glycoside hydrolase family 43 protein, partial [Isosphaeraceae bacterium]